MSDIIVISPEQLEKIIERTLYKVLQNIEDKSERNFSDEVLDIKQAGEYLHMPFRSIYNLTYKRLIPHFKKGKRLLFNKEDLNEWIKSGKKETIEEIKKNLIRKKNSKR